MEKDCLIYGRGIEQKLNGKCFDIIEKLDLAMFPFELYRCRYNGDDYCLDAYELLREGLLAEENHLFFQK